MPVTLLLAATIDLCVAPGSAKAPSAVFPLKPAEDVVSVWYDRQCLHFGSEVLSWSDLGVTPTNGAVVRLERKAADGEPISIRMTLKKNATAFAVPHLKELLHRRVAGELVLRPRKDGTVRLQCACGGARSPVLRQFKSAAVKKGERTSIALAGDTPDMSYVTFTVTDVDGSNLFLPVGWYVRDPSVHFAIRVLHTDRARQIMYVRSDNWFGAGHSLRVDMLDFDSGKKKWSTVVPAIPTKSPGHTNMDGISEQPVDVSGLPPGQYKCVVTLVGPDGKDIQDDYAFYAKPDGKAPWEGTKLGAEDTVPPPWTLPVFEKDTFTCWNREVKFGGDGLVRSIVSDGKELLASPVTVELDGRPLSFDGELVRKGVSEAYYSLKAHGAPVRVGVRCEFDGVMWFDVTWKPPVKALVVRVPVDRKLVTGFDDCSSHKVKLPLPQGKTCGFDYDPSSKMYWWMGSNVGLLGGVDNLRGWRLKDSSRGYRLDVDGKSAILSMRVVDVPLASGEPRTFSFYLEPTPVKPKDMRLASTPISRINYWTGHVERFFEDKWPGRIVEERMAPFRREMESGKRVFFYNATKGASQTFPWWGWFSDDWNMFGSPELYFEEAPFAPRSNKDENAWTYGCPNRKDFLEYKVWSVCWLLSEPSLGIRDLYWDLSNPGTCQSDSHGCGWTDEFGNARKDGFMRSVREIHKRVYRVLKRRDPTAAMIQHLRCERTPSDVFADGLVMGEGYDYDLCYPLAYYDILTPDLMQICYAARAREVSVIMLPEIVRAIQMFQADKYASYDRLEPKNDLAIRHGTAYFKIHDLTVGGFDSDGEHWHRPDEILSTFANRRHSAYYTGDCPVSVSNPSDRFLYALYEGDGGRKMLILLNDTDKEVEEGVSVRGLSAVGKDIFGRGAFDFTSGTCSIRLSRRDSLFILFSPSL